MLSGSEFALRVAVCDLVQRLKRCEQMCQYLEACRNELAKECIKLRHENYCLSKQVYQFTNDRNIEECSSKINLLPADAQPVKPRTEYNGKVLDTVSEERGFDARKADAVSDESWEEITARLIKEMKREVIGAYLAQKDFNGAHQAEEYSSKHSKEYQTPVTNIQAEDASVAAKELDGDEARDEKAVEQNLMILEAPIPKIKNVIKVEGAIKQYNFADVLKAVEKSYKDGTPQEKDARRSEPYERLPLKDEEQQSIANFCAEVLHNVNYNMDHLTRILSQQNDRLTRLKSKQLRNYFRRQLDCSPQAAKPDAIVKPNLEHV